jgi:N-acyl-D-aspartate/D-glutamate deacylase
MGEAAIERAANDDERARIRDLLKEAVAAGAFGFSTTQLPNHMGHRGRPIACRQADRAELREYAQVLRDAGRGFIEVALTEQMSVLSDSNLEMLEFLLRESGRPVTWLASDLCPTADARHGSADAAFVHEFQVVAPRAQPVGRGAKACLRRPCLS